MSGGEYVLGFSGRSLLTTTQRLFGSVIDLACLLKGATVGVGVGVGVALGVVPAVGTEAGVEALPGVL
jgi:hypothetical protein